MVFTFEFFDSIWREISINGTWSSNCSGASRLNAAAVPHST